MKDKTALGVLIAVAFLCLGFAIVGCSADGTAEGKVAGKVSSDPSAVFPWVDAPASKPAK